jgi:hypothetical protein
MSRNQKPGKFKLVGSTPAPPRRRIGDRSGSQPAGKNGLDRQGADPAAEPSSRLSLLLPLSFVLGCAGGGSAAVYFGLVGGLAG